MGQPVEPRSSRFAQVSHFRPKSIPALLHRPPRAGLCHLRPPVRRRNHLFAEDRGADKGLAGLTGKMGRPTGCTSLPGPKQPAGNGWHCNADHPTRALLGLGDARACCRTPGLGTFRFRRHCRWCGRLYPLAGLSRLEVKAGAWNLNKQSLPSPLCQNCELEKARLIFAGHLPSWSLNRPLCTALSNGTGTAAKKSEPFSPGEAKGSEKGRHS